MKSELMVANNDEFFMRLALAEAHKAYRQGEIPVGAVVVANGAVVGRGYNLTETLNDVTAHAEMQAITAAAGTIGGKYLTDCTLYVTLEPCVMCAGAIAWAQIPKIVIGAADEKRGYTTYVRRSPFHPAATITQGVLADECAEILKQFFREKRRSSGA